MARGRRVDRARFPHTYVGPTTKFGLPTGAACRILAKRGQGYRIRTENGRVWLVGLTEVKTK